MSKNVAGPNGPEHQDELSADELDEVSGGITTATGISMTIDDGPGSKKRQKTGTSSSQNGTIRTASGIVLTIDD